MTTGKIKRVRLKLSCSHVVEYPRLEAPSQGHTVFCVTCDDWHMVEAPDTREYHTHCKECSFGRWTGQDSHGMIQFGNMHANRTGHIMIFAYEEAPDTTKALRREYR